MSQDEPGWVSLDIHQEATPIQQRRAQETFTERYNYAVKSRTHLWIITVAHFCSDRTLDAISGKIDDMPILDAESIAMIPAVGCFVCETPFEPRLRLRKCPGEPQ